MDKSKDLMRIKDNLDKALKISAELDTQFESGASLMDAIRSALTHLGACKTENDGHVDQDNG